MLLDAWIFHACIKIDMNGMKNYDRGTPTGMMLVIPVGVA
jgi:hypothetical protein